MGAQKEFVFLIRELIALDYMSLTIGDDEKSSCAQDRVSEHTNHDVAAENKSGRHEQRLSPINMLNEARYALVDLLIKHLKARWAIDLSKDREILAKQMSEPPQSVRNKTNASEKPRDLCISAAFLARKIPGSPKPDHAASELAKLCRTDQASVVDICSDVAASGVYINFTLSLKFLGRVVPLALRGEFLAPLSSEGKERVMIEYSQVGRWVGIKTV